MASVPKIHQGFGQIFEWDNKKGHLDKWWFYENDKFGKNLFKVWQKLKQDEKRGMSIIVDFTKMTFFPKRTGEFGKDWDNVTTKQLYWQLAFLTKMANLGKWGIEQESTHDLVKTSNEVTKRGVLTKDKFRQIWWVCQKFIKGLAKYSNEMTKRGMLIVGDFQDNDKFCDDGEFGKKLSKVWQKFTKRWQKGASWQMAIITNMANWATIHLRFFKIRMRWQTRHVDNWEFYENDKWHKCCKIREFGKDSSKVWENCLLIISENSNFGLNGQFGKNLSKVWQELK